MAWLVSQTASIIAGLLLVDAADVVHLRVGWSRGKKSRMGNEHRGLLSGCILTSSDPSNWQTYASGSGEGSTSSVKVQIIVRSERDPYLYFLDLSDGSLSLGLSTGEKVCSI